MQFKLVLLSISLTFFLQFGNWSYVDAQRLSANISGTITVDRALDSTGDYSGIGVAIVHFDPNDNRLDTLFYAVTDLQGRFSGIARFQTKDEYVISVTRNQRLISTSTLVLANGEDVRISSQIPNFTDHFRAESPENTAVSDFRRVERNYSRIVDYINAGFTSVSQDTIPILMRTWSDLFWSLNDLHPGTLAAESGTLRAVEILQGWDDDRTIYLAKQSLLSQNRFIADRALIAAEAITRTRGLEYGLAFIDSVRTVDIPEDDHIILEIRKIELLSDFNERERALRYLNDFRSKYGEDFTLLQWANMFAYDLENLAKGMPMPEFQLNLRDERTVTNSDFEGKYLIVEIVNLASRRYMTDHTIMRLLYEDVRDKVQFLTIPTNESPVTISAFYDERQTPWPVSKARQVYAANLIELLNVVVQPTRLLIDPNGNIVRKYSGTEFSIIENELRTLLNQDPS